MRNIPSSKMENFCKNFRSLVLRSSKFPVKRSYEYMTNRKNLLVITLSALKRSQHDNPIIYVYCIYERSEGRYAAVWALGNRITIFAPHFFDRYQERVLKNDAIPRNEVIQLFITNSWANVSLEINDELEAIFKCFEGHYNDETISIVSATSEGYCFGEVIDDVKMMKTIITEDMLSDRQKRLFHAIRESFTEANQKLHGRTWSISDKSKNT